MVISKSRKITKLFFLLTFSGLLMYAILAFYYIHKAYVYNYEEINQNQEVTRRIDGDLKYILIETKNPESFASIQGQKLFIDNQCPQFTCYLTANEKLLMKKQEFDAVIVNVTDLSTLTVPLLKAAKQVYIFYGMEPSDQVDICNPDVDNIFNYTWSYKLDSDIVSPFFTVRDVNNSVIAPNLYAQWTMSLPKSSLKREEVMKLKNKSKAVAMVVRNCKDNDGKIFANRLRAALKVYSEELHVFGCKRNDSLSNGIGAVIAAQYFYVLVVIGGTAKDYVTDSILKAYWNNAVPIVRARADLTKFLPPGSYINAHLQTPEQIAALVHYSINNPSVYRSFFKWRNFYTFRKRTELDGLCKLCSLLNDKSSFYSNSSANLREWWSGSTKKMKCGKMLS